MVRHFGHGLPADVGGRRFGVECIARQQDRVGPTLTSVSCERSDHGVARLAQSARQIPGEIAETFAQV
jgi:hypothetical protein